MGRLDMKEHPVGTRFVARAASRYGKQDLTETHVLEWSKNGNAVRLKPGGWTIEFPHVVDVLDYLRSDDPLGWQDIETVPRDAPVLVKLDWGMVTGNLSAPSALVCYLDSDDVWQVVQGGRLSKCATPVKWRHVPE